MNSTENLFSISWLNSFEWILFNTYKTYNSIPVKGLIGFVTNLICLLVIFSSMFKDRNKFNYVIVKIAIETSGCLYFIGFQVIYMNLNEQILSHPIILF